VENDSPMSRRSFIGAATTLAALGLALAGGLAQTRLPTGTTEGHARSRDGTPIGYLKLGTGPGVVFVHGSLALCDEYLPVAERLAGRHTCYLMDRRGRGRSGDAQAYSLDTECEDIKAVLEVAGPDASLFGHSYGAICTLETASRTAPRSVVLYEPPFPISRMGIGEAEFSAYRAAVQQGRFEDALVIGLRDLVKMSETQLAELRSTPIWTDIVPLAPTWVRELEEIKKLPFGVARYAAMKSPTLLLVGTETAPHHIEASDALQRTLPDARTVRFQGQGHDAHLFVVDEFARRVSDFLAEA
jgi:pimeloyl-ACP methyl ester carboxylesterase